MSGLSNWRKAEVLAAVTHLACTLGVKIQEPAFRGTMKPKTFGFANRLWDKRKATNGVAFLYLIMKVTTYIFTYRKKRGYKNIV